MVPELKQIQDVKSFSFRYFIFYIHLHLCCEFLIRSNLLKSRSLLWSEKLNEIYIYDMIYNIILYYYKSIT